MAAPLGCHSRLLGAFSLLSLLAGPMLGQVASAAWAWGLPGLQKPLFSAGLTTSLCLDAVKPELVGVHWSENAEQRSPPAP